MEEYRITIAGQSKYEIELCAVQCGRDYSVTICGGGRHHVGAAALGCDESGTVGHKMRGATVSVLCVFGHRDDEAARWAAKYLATELKCNVSVAVGIHIDHADGSEIQCRYQRCTRPEPSPPASFSTSATVMRLKSPSIECLRAEAATANSMAAWLSFPASRA